MAARIVDSRSQRAADESRRLKEDDNGRAEQPTCLRCARRDTRRRESRSWRAGARERGGGACCNADQRVTPRHARIRIMIDRSGRASYQSAGCTETAGSGVGQRGTVSKALHFFSLMGRRGNAGAKMQSGKAHQGGAPEACTAPNMASTDCAISPALCVREGEGERWLDPGCPVLCALPGGGASSFRRMSKLMSAGVTAVDSPAASSGREPYGQELRVGRRAGASPALDESADAKMQTIRRAHVCAVFGA